MFFFYIYFHDIPIVSGLGRFRLLELADDGDDIAIVFGLGRFGLLELAHDVPLAHDYDDIPILFGLVRFITVRKFL